MLAAGVRYEASVFACSGACISERRTIACWRRFVSDFEVSCLEHTPTGTLFVVGERRENLDDPMQLARAGYTFFLDEGCERLRSIADRCPVAPASD